MVNELLQKISESVDRDIYIWGGQGQVVPSEAWIKKKETNSTHRNNALKLYRKRLLTFKPEEIRCYDCSGLMTKNMLDMGLIPSDMTANGIKGRCTLIDKAQAKKGCFVFRVYKSGSKKGRAYHVGIVADDELNVIESRGRAYGVIKRTMNASGSGYWNAFGVLKVLADEINTNLPDKITGATYTRLLKYKRPYLRGADITLVQKALLSEGFSPGSIDGIFGKNTRKAVRLFQKAARIKVDGIVGPITWAKLFG